MADTSPTEMDVPRRLFGKARCPECGATVPAAELLQGEHACDPDALEAHQAALVALEQIELLRLELDEFLRSRETENRLAFARWCREHGR